MEQQPISTIEQKDSLEISLESTHRVQKLHILDIFHQGRQEEAVEAVIAWTEGLEKWRSDDPTPRRGILIELARSDFYLAAQDTEGALECLDAASLQARDQGYFDLETQAEDRISTVLKVSRSIDSNK